MVTKVKPNINSVRSSSIELDVSFSTSAVIFPNSMFDTILFGLHVILDVTCWIFLCINILKHLHPSLSPSIKHIAWVFERKGRTNHNKGGTSRILLPHILTSSSLNPDCCKWGLAVLESESSSFAILGDPIWHSISWIVWPIKNLQYTSGKKYKKFCTHKSGSHVNKE